MSSQIASRWRRQAALMVLLLAKSIGVNTLSAATVALTPQNGTFLVPVLINSKLTLDFTIDSGATDVTIPLDVFSTLIRSGTVAAADILDKQRYEQADGSTAEGQRFRIQSLRVGNVEVREVLAAVTPASGPLLLGQSFLTKLQSWSIDNQRQLLLINESYAGADVSEAPASSSVVKKTRWEFMGRSMAFGVPGPLDFVDVTSIKISGDIRHAWFKEVLPPKKGKRANFELRRKTLWAFNCQDDTYREEVSTSYTARGVQDGYYDTAGTTITWRPAIPDSEASYFLRWVCDWKSE